MSGEMRIRIIDLVGALSRALDLVSPAVVNHHMRVGFIASRLAHAVGCDAQTQRNVLVAGLMHDAGALSLRTRLDTLAFEADMDAHAEAGYRLIATCPALSDVARLVRHHHTKFRDIEDAGGAIPMESNILYLADRVDVLMQRRLAVEEQIRDVLPRIEPLAGSLFSPAYVGVLRELLHDGAFCACADNPADHLCTLAPEKMENEALDLEQVGTFSRLFAHIIDFRSRFTATHSSGVGFSSVALARMAGISDIELAEMRIAGDLHDLGKLGVPSELLEKPAALTEWEFGNVRRHTAHCEGILGAVAGLERITEWASSHHERLNGSGYHAGKRGDELSAGARIIAVADVFTAITEDRPYRRGMDDASARKVLRGMARDGALDAGVVTMLMDDFSAINEQRRMGQEAALFAFQAFNATTGNP